jgi:predicted glycogen debranching enzyme
MELRGEWLEADGLGGYASGTVRGERSRRYHALLLTAVRPPTVRMVLINGAEVFAESATGQRVALSTQHYAPDVLAPDGVTRIIGFTHVPWPQWRFALPDGGVVTQEIFTARDACETVLRWRLSGAANWTLKVRPLLSGRDHGGLHRENAVFDFRAAISNGNVSWRPYAGVPAISALTNGVYTHAPVWYRNFLYAIERDRGLDDLEDLAAPGEFSFSLGDPAVMVLRAGDGLAVRPAQHAEDLAAAERARRSRLGERGTAAASYIVDRGAGRTIIAGFPWFTDWGRDSFISLRGLLIGEGRFNEAGQVLLEWAGTVSEGMLPNRFPDDGGAPEFNAVDASLWFVVAVHDYLQAAPADLPTELRLRDAVLAILAGYASGTRYGIGADADGLLRAGVPGVQLTWMDAITAGHVVTPRIGKPVEVQALWIVSLRIARRWTTQWEGLEAQARASFATRFPRPEGGLYDVVDADNIAGNNDAKIRPNQIFAVGGLPFAVIEGALAAQVVAEVEAHLLTPLGLRTLAPDDPDYIGCYRGNLTERDAAYHQGTVWPWLMGAFVQAWLAVNGDDRQTASRRFLAPLREQLVTNGLGHLTEVADGDAPHNPGGCPFQAWSMGELMRIEKMLTL